MTVFSSDRITSNNNKMIICNRENKKKGKKKRGYPVGGVGYSNVKLNLVRRPLEFLTKDSDLAFRIELVAVTRG